jgi:hypothetical protein
VLEPQPAQRFDHGPGPGLYYVGRDGNTTWHLDTGVQPDTDWMRRPELDVCLALIRYATDQLTALAADQDL